MEKKYEASYGYRQVGTTLVQNRYRAVPPDQPILWVWEATALSPAEAALLRQLLRRVLYFGRAESYCRFRIIRGEGITPNCRLATPAGSGNPVLAAVPGTDLNFTSLLAVTDGDLLKQRRIPPGTAWYHATIPAPRPVRVAPAARRRYPPDVDALQFAVGGRVYPSQAHWVKLTERFREEVIRQRCVQASEGRTTRFRELSGEARDALSLIQGLDGAGNRVEGQATAFFALVPDAAGLPTRLLCWRRSPFTDAEIDWLRQRCRAVAQVAQIDVMPLEGPARPRVPPLQYQRTRRKAGDDGGWRQWGIYRVTFTGPVAGPLCLGHASHFGLGLFLPVLADPPQSEPERERGEQAVHGISTQRPHGFPGRSGPDR